MDQIFVITADLGDWLDVVGVTDDETKIDEMIETYDTEGQYDICVNKTKPSSMFRESEMVREYPRGRK